MTAAAKFSLGTFARQDGKSFAAIVFDDRALSLDALFTRIGSAEHLRAASIRSLLADWDENFALLSAASDQVASDGVASSAWREAFTKVSDLRTLPPVQPVGAIFQAAANYRTHLRQMILAARGKDKALTPEDEAQVERQLDQRSQGLPFIFQGLPGAVCGAYDDVILPKIGTQHDWELELAVIFGPGAKSLPRDRALECVAGYTISNDLTTRDLVFRGDAGGLGADWLRGKNSPTFLPTGPYLVPRAFVPDPSQLHITLKLNSQVMQDSGVSDMMFDVPRLIEYVTSFAPIAPGDMLLTGSPAGNGIHWGRLLREGDVMESEITGLGKQLNRCVVATE